MSYYPRKAAVTERLRRNAIERMFGRHKDFHRIATRYDRLAANYLAAVCLAADVLKPAHSASFRSWDKDSTIKPWDQAASCLAVTT